MSEPIEIGTVAKKVIVVAADHTDIGGHHRDAIVKYLKGAGRKVIELEHGSKDDSYVKIAGVAALMIRSHRGKEGAPDSAVLIDKYGSGMSSVSNSVLGVIASVVWGPQMAREVTRKNNPRIICVPTFTEEREKGIVEISPKYAVEIVKAWLNTEFLEGISPEEQKKYIERERENLRIHLRSFGSIIRKIKTWR